MMLIGCADNVTSCAALPKWCRIF